METFFIPSILPVKYQSHPMIMLDKQTYI